VRDLYLHRPDDNNYTDNGSASGLCPQVYGAAFKRFIKAVLDGWSVSIFTRETKACLITIRLQEMSRCCLQSDRCRLKSQWLGWGWLDTAQWKIST